MCKFTKVICTYLNYINLNNLYILDPLNDIYALRSMENLL